MWNDQERKAMIDFAERLEIMMAFQRKGDNDSIANVKEGKHPRLPW